MKNIINEIAKIILAVSGSMLVIFCTFTFLSIGAKIADRIFKALEPLSTMGLVTLGLTSLVMAVLGAIFVLVAFLKE